MILVKKDNRQGNLEELSSLSVVYTNQSIPYYSSTRMLGSGSVTGGGKGLCWHLVLYYWLIPNHNNTKDGIISSISGVREACVKGTKGCECGSNGHIILGDKEALVCMGLLGLVLVCSGVVPMGNGGINSYHGWDASSV